MLYRRNVPRGLGGFPDMVNDGQTDANVCFAGLHYLAGETGSQWKKYAAFISKNVKVEKEYVNTNAYPGCSNRIPGPNFYPSRIPDLGSRIQQQ